MSRGSSIDLAGHKLTVEVGRVATQANGAVFMHYGDIVVLATATASSKPREGIDSSPLSVEYEEKLYSVGKIPGGFNKREGRAPENAVFTCRVTDRPTRPLFPKDYRSDVALDNIVTSVGSDCSPELTAMLGSVIVTNISDAPLAGPCATIQVNLMNGEPVIDPTADQKQVSDMALTVASIKEEMIMIEAGVNEVPEQQVIDAIFKAHEANQEIICFIDTTVTECSRGEHTYESYAVPEELFTAIREIAPPSKVRKAVLTDGKRTRERNIAVVTEHLEEVFADNEEWLSVLGEVVYQYQKKTVCKMALKDHKRPDGRAIDQIRRLVAEVDLLPRVHGSSIFTHGQTQTLNACTLAPLSDAQRINGPDEDKASKRYMYYYNFPSFFVSEIKPSEGPGCRRIGHSALTERALIPVLSSAKKFPHAIRTVPETMGSSGSTPQAGIYTFTLSLMAAGMPIGEMIAGISCSLVTGNTDDDYIVLTDVRDLEGFFGDVGFKTGGIRNGITATQMDIKIYDLTRPIIEEAITRAGEARVHILEGVMKPVTSEPRKHLSPYVPRIRQISIDLQKASDVIGKQDKVINGIIEKIGVKVNTTDDGPVSVRGMDETMIDRAIVIITGIVTDIEAGMISSDGVVRIMNLGVFVKSVLNKDGTVYVSKLSDRRVGKAEDVVDIGNEVTVKVAEVNKTGRINLTMRPSDLADKKGEVVAEK